MAIEKTANANDKSSQPLAVAIKAVCVKDNITPIIKAIAAANRKILGKFSILNLPY